MASPPTSKRSSRRCASRPEGRGVEAVALAWTATVGRLRPQWRRVRPLAPYLIALALPGSFIWLPLLAWWQRRQRARS